MSQASIYSVCSLCGPHAEQCARFNSKCAVPKTFMTSEKAYDRAVQVWARDIIKKKGVVHHRAVEAPRDALTEPKFMLYFEDEWID